MAELSKEELDMVIMSELMVCSGTDELTSGNKKVTHESKEMRLSTGTRTRR